jgi:xanthine/CO dehydrogenase XdhC/CoxF family maturation factor
MEGYSRGAFQRSRSASVIVLVRVTAAAAEVEIKPGTYVVVANHHKGDHLSLKKAMDCQAGYSLWLPARTRSQLIFEYLETVGMTRKNVTKVRSPQIGQQKEPR